MFSELKKFLMRGDVLSLAVAVIIAGAFGKIVDSLVADLINPVLAMLTGGADFSQSWIIGADAEGKGGFRIGSFVQAIINFMLIGTVLFFLIRSAGKNSADIK